MLEGRALRTANSIDRLAEQLRDVKAIQDVDGRAAFANDFEERLPHVAGDECNGFRTRVAEHVEEAMEAGCRPLFGDVEQTTMSLIELVNEREVLVALFPGELVDADGPNAFEVAMLQPPSHRVLDATEDGVPTRVKSASALRPRERTRPTCNEPHIRVRRVRLSGRPWHHLDRDAATPTFDPSHGIHEEDGDVPKRDERELPRRQDVIPASVRAAPRADGARTSPGADVHVQRRARSRARPPDAVIDKTWMLLNPSQYKFEVHRAFS
jgi:hypothetical protein